MSTCGVQEVGVCRRAPGCDVDLSDPRAQLAGAGVSAAECLRLSIYPMTFLLHPKHAFNRSDGELVTR